MDSDPNKRAVNSRDLRKRYANKCTRTIARWKKSRVLPRPDFTINGIDYWWLSTIEANERRLIGADSQPQHDRSATQAAKAVHVTAGNHAGTRAQRGLEQYGTPVWAIKPLPSVEALPKNIWEICSPPNGNIVTTLEAHGYHVVANDITVDGIDFRQRRAAPPGVEAIVTNPPFSLAADFVQHGLSLVPKVVILQRIQFLETETRADLFDAGKLVRVWVFRNRVPHMHRAGWTGKKAGGSMNLAWFVFERDHNGSAPTIRWIRCER